ncbi:DUF934 domain-containing protein [Roseinatronobacter alkalisoli]|uniref:DUF934 domain-containing protein n=1 Tax=Roseinatronobacter alkalisoli TaxID=3028235 RepID=A0ABT5T6E5_9RHOB|nr:DUF934 domain-containing protein [Roseinatronobacter sp. HJB301]MDD7970551.1 DUF934 domain-containing protein [Roseinatronobacter sp. HJB301]
MTIIVTDTGFGPETFTGTWADLAPDASDDALHEALAQNSAIRVQFPAFSDGRGFTLAARLRRMGFSGRLRAQGHVIADQYAMARRSGFDEVEISAELATRQPESQWLARADWRANDYRRKLRRAG